MKRTTYVSVIGIPREVLDSFPARFARKQQATLIPLRSLWSRTNYTDEYADLLYERIGLELRKRQPACRNALLRDANLILLYVDRNDGSESSIVRRFGVEALVMPLDLRGADSKDRVTGNQRREMINILLDEIEGALEKARELLGVIAEEVVNRDNTTCLLLPPETFGKEFRSVHERIVGAARMGEGSEEFRKSLKRLRALLPSIQKNRKRYYVGKGSRVFASPGRERHGLPPLWGDDQHQTTCVIRGRLRFGVSFDPRFHYDCDIGSGGGLFPGCHEPQTVKNVTHVNVAPNDSVRL